MYRPLGVSGWVLVLILLIHSGITQGSPQMMIDHLKELYNTHIENTQRSDKKWDITLYKKKPRGFYEQTQQASKRTTTAWKICGVAFTVTFASMLGLSLTMPKKHNSQEPVPASADLCGWTLVLAGATTIASAIYGAGNSIYISHKVHGYNKDYQPRDNQEKELHETVEYYKWHQWKGQSTPFISMSPTIATFPYKE